jgi:signal transduction histidine kinase
MTLLPRVWPRGLGGRATVVLLAAVVLLHLGSLALYYGEAADASGTVLASQVAGRLSTAVRAVADAGPERRDEVAHALSSPHLALHWGELPVVEPEAPGAKARGATAAAELRRRILALAPDLGELAVRLGHGDPPAMPPLLLGSVRLRDGSWLNVSAQLDPLAAQVPHAALLSTTLMAGGVVAVAVLLLRTLTSPLRRLAGAADAMGRGPEVRVPESGPEEARQVARAFNAMQARMGRLVADRTQALAAVSHDLRTPITRLRLRAGFLADGTAQAAMDADLDEMEAMVEATLAYLGGQEDEAPGVVDLAVLLATLVDAAADAGHSASYSGLDHLSLVLRRLAVKRAFANLLDNALAYGGTARVTLAASAAGVQVWVDDDGPGIPDEALERVFEPFQRLEASRNRGTGGTGLGLAIARQAVARERGTVRLLNRAGGGLRAEVSFPIGPGTGLPHSPATLHVLPTK